jgi:hypothetical protein
MISLVGAKGACIDKMLSMFTSNYRRFSVSYSSKSWISRRNVRKNYIYFTREAGIAGYVLLQASVAPPEPFQAQQNSLYPEIICSDLSHPIREWTHNRISGLILILVASYLCFQSKEE